MHQKATHSLYNLSSDKYKLFLFLTADLFLSQIIFINKIEYNQPWKSFVVINYFIYELQRQVSGQNISRRQTWPKTYAFPTQILAPLDQPPSTTPQQYQSIHTRLSPQ